MLKFRWETEFQETEIGEIPKEWEIKKVEEIAEKSILGSTPLKRKIEYWSNGSIPWLTNKEMEYGQVNIIKDTELKVNEKALKETNLNLIPPFSLIVSFTASVGKVGINKISITTNQQFISFVLNKNTSVLYYGYYFVLAKEIIESFSGATPFSFITKEKALQILVPYPPLSEQSRIATVLSWFDDLIENKKRQNEILEKTAMAIFKSWFVDFEPFQNEEFVYSEELGREIPKGWEVKKVGAIFKLIKGRKCTVVNKPQNGALPYLLIESFKTGEELWTLDKINHLYIVSEEDIVFVADGESSGKIFRYKYGILGSTLLYLHVKNPDDSLYIRNFTYLFLKFHEEDIMSHRTGSAIPHLDKSYLQNFSILLPPFLILQRFHELVEPLFKKIILNQKEIMILRKARDALLPKLVFGKLRVVEI